MHFVGPPVALSNTISSYFVSLPTIPCETDNKVFATKSFLIHFISIFFTSMLIISLWYPVINKLRHDIPDRATPKLLLIISLVIGGTQLRFPVVVLNLWPNDMFSNLFFLFHFSSMIFHYRPRNSYLLRRKHFSKILFLKFHLKIAQKSSSLYIR